MSPAQRASYFRRWKAACDKQGWTRKNGFTTAQVNELRHLEQARALGGVVKSSNDLVTQPEITRVFSHFDLLADDANLNAASKSIDPERHNLIWSIEQTPAAYRNAVMLPRFKTTNLHALDNSDLVKLRNTLSARANTLRRRTKPQPATAAHAESEGIDRPF